MLERVAAAPPPLPVRRRVTATAFLARHGASVALTALLLLALVATPNFLSLRTLNVNLTQVAGIVVVALGMTLVVATGGIDLSVGSLMAIAGALAPMLFLGQLVPLPAPWVGVALALTVPLLVTGALGWLNGLLVTRYRIQPIVATLVLLIAGRGIAQVITNGNLQAGHLFLAYQQDVHRQFETVQNRLTDEPLIDYVQPFGGGYFYVLPGVTTSRDWYARSLLT